MLIYGPCAAVEDEVIDDQEDEDTEGHLEARRWRKRREADTLAQGEGVDDDVADGQLKTVKGRRDRRAVCRLGTHMGLDKRVRPNERGNGIRGDRYWQGIKNRKRSRRG